MKRAAVKDWKPPPDLAEVIGDPPLDWSEKREDYDKLLALIAEAARPTDTIAWLLVYEITNLSWEILREQSVKRKIIEVSETVEFMNWMNETRGISKDDSLKVVKATRNDGSLDVIENGLGIDLTDVRTVALSVNHKKIDLFDRRIASLEARRKTAIRAHSEYNEKFARRLETASREVVEGYFTRAAE